MYLVISLFGFEGRIWDLIVSVPDHCLSFYFAEGWKKELDSQHYVGAVLMDLSKAFDCLPHDLIMAKLKAYGLSTGACEFLNGYLSDRRQRVKIGQNHSNWLNILKGVPY